MLSFLENAKPMSLFHKENPETFFRKISRRIAEIRLEMGLTQEEFAEQLNVDTRTLQRWEAKENLSLWTLYRLTVVSGRPASDFFMEPTMRRADLRCPRKSRIRRRS